MLTVEAALARVLGAARPVIREEVPLEVAFGRVLAEDLRAPTPLPPWDDSAMDGYAVASEGLGEEATLTVIETIPAGRVGSRRVVHGTTARIMTGAPMPEGADAVVIREDSAPVPGEGPEQVRLMGGAHPGMNVRRAGSELAVGDRVLRAGQTLSPPAVGLAASLGWTTLPVAARPRVALLSTGDELVAPGMPRGPGQIWSSNALSLAGLVLEAGGLPLDCGLVPDTLEGTRAAFQRALGCDIILSTGGVSVGDYDVVKAALAAEGAELDFWKVRMKPGKPLAYGHIAGRPVFGLPGNPVSCVVNFLQFVRPVIRRSLGDPRPFLPVLDATLRDAVRRAPGREELLRVSLAWEGGRLIATPGRRQGSGQLSGVAEGHGFALIAGDRAELSAGETVAVQVFDPSFAASEEPGYRW